MAERKEPDDKRALAVELQGRLMTGIAVVTGLTLLIGLGVVFGPGASQALKEMAATNPPPRNVAATEPAGRERAARSQPPATAKPQKEPAGEEDRDEAEAEAGRKETAGQGEAPHYRTILYDARLRPAL